MNYLAENLRHLRKLRGATLAQFAEEVGIARSTLQWIEHGFYPNLSTLEVITQSLDIPVSALLGEPEELLSLRLVQQFPWLNNWPQTDLAQLCTLLQQISVLLLHNSNI